MGLTAIKLNEQFPEARLIAVEADSDSAEICRMNLSHIRDAVILQAAIGWGPGLVKCLNPEAPSISRRFGSCDVRDLNSVQQITIREIMDRYQCRSPILIKMDIEGAEAACFEHSDTWLPWVDAVLVEAHSATEAKYIRQRFLHENFAVTYIGEKLFGERKRSELTPAAEL